MRRDLDLVLVAPEDLHGSRVPFGQLRASAASLDAADALIVDGELDAVAREARVARLPRFQLVRTLSSVALYGHLGGVRQNDVGSDTAGHATYLAVAGIARPERFQAALQAAGVRVARLLAFRDHHRYTAADARAIADAVRAAGAAGVVTTAKDAVRLAPLRPWPFALAVARLDVAVEPRDAFRQLVFDRLTAVRAR
jgi:tetraacyldisaccharide 4'-kinase